MTDTNDPKGSPDFLAGPPKKGAGVRRLNKVPLIVVGALVALAIIGVTYTFHERQQRSIRQAETPEEIEIPEEPMAAPVRPVGPEFVPAADETPPPTEFPTERAGQGTGTTASGAMSEQEGQALQARLRLIQRAEENRLAAWEAALGAEPGVQTFQQHASQPAPGSSSAPQGGATRPAGAAALPDLLANLRGNQNTDPNRQDDKQGFLRQQPDPETYLAHTRVPPISPYEVKAGTVIPGVMIGGVNSDLPGQIIGQVREDVYDSATGDHLLIPAGARLIGTYDSTVTLGQRRVLVAWTRIIYQDGSSVKLDVMPGADQAGYAGFNDKVNNHYWRIFGNAMMLSLFSAGIQLSQPEAPVGGTYDSQQIMAAELGRQMGQLGMEMTRRNMDIQPTLEIRPGYLFNVMVTKDMVLAPWRGGSTVRQ